MNYLKRSLAIATLVISIGVGTSYGAGCLYMFDEDNCQNVACPSSCYATGSFGTHKSVCQMQGDDLLNCRS